MRLVSGVVRAIGSWLVQLDGGLFVLIQDPKCALTDQPRSRFLTPFLINIESSFTSKNRLH